MTAQPPPGEPVVHVVLVHRRAGDLMDEQDGCERALVHAASALRAITRCHVTAVAVGRAQDQEPWLELAARSGCDRLVCVSIDREQSDAPGHRGIAELACAALEQLESDVILCATCPPGSQSGVYAPALAHIMDMAHLSGVIDIRAGQGTREIVVAQRADARIHQWRCALPVVLGVWARPLDADVDAAADIDADADAVELEIEYLSSSLLEAARAGLPRQLLGEVRTAPVAPAIIVASPDELLTHLDEGRAPR